MGTWSKDIGTFTAWWEYDGRKYLRYDEMGDGFKRAEIIPISNQITDHQGDSDEKECYQIVRVGKDTFYVYVSRIEPQHKGYVEIPKRCDGKRIRTDDPKKIEGLANLL